MRTLDRITVDPRVMNGQPTIRGMRLTVRRVLQMLAVNPDWQRLRAEYPELEIEDEDSEGFARLLRQTLRAVGSALSDGAAVTVNEHSVRVRRLPIGRAALE